MSDESGDRVPIDEGDLASWFLACLDEEEQVARAAAEINPIPWWADRGYVYGQVTAQNRHLDGGLWDNEGAESLSMDPATASHIARHDPARVLAEVAAKRAIVEWAQSNPRTCSDVHPMFDVWHPDGHGPHDVLRLLAVPYADQPGYDEAWRP